MEKMKICLYCQKYFSLRCDTMKEAAGLWLVINLLPLRYQIVKLVVYFFAVPLLEMRSLSSNASYQKSGSIN